MSLSTTLNRGFRIALALAGALTLAACANTNQDQAAAGRATPGSSQDFVVNVGDRVFFTVDATDVTPEGRTTLDRQATWLRQYPRYTFTIEGHADERGTREYNLALGERRANAAKNFLAAQGVGADRMSIISYGKERPAVDGSNEEAWAQNRRAVTVVVSGGR